MTISVKDHKNKLEKTEKIESGLNSRNYVEFFDILIDQIKNNPDDFKSNSIDNYALIEKYGENFLDFPERLEYDDFDYFNISIFIGVENPLIIVPIGGKIYFILNHRSISFNIDSEVITTFEDFKSKMESLNAEN